MAKIKAKKNKRAVPTGTYRPARRIDIIGISIVWLLILMLWAVCIMNLTKGNYFGYRNYYDQPVGTLVLLIFLVVATPAFFIMTIETIRNRKVDLYSEPEWMDTPPWKWPWH